MIIVGISVRLAIAPFSGHPDDIGFLAVAMRLFYTHGVWDLRYFPTLPPIYYLELMSYAPYSLLRSVGFQDVLFLYHTAYMLETIFLKMPMIISDFGIFYTLLRFTKNLRYASLYLLNPFVIFLSGAWGTYDAVMLLPLTFGFVCLSQGKTRLASLGFALSGMVKLFGFIPFTFLAFQNIAEKRTKEVLLQIGTCIGLGAMFMLPIALEGGLGDFYSGFILRFVGSNGAQTKTWNVFAALYGTKFGGATPVILPLAILVAGLFLYDCRRKFSIEKIMLWTIAMAGMLNIFSQSEPQWLSWLIPSSIMYSFRVRKESIAQCTYTFGIGWTFLTMTLTQGTGYLLSGRLLTQWLGAQLEGIPNGLAVYSITSLSMILILIGHLFTKPGKFRTEVIALTAIIYAQSYFWFSIVAAGKL